MSFASSNVDVVFGGGNLGGGKEMPLNAKILTPSGWQTMGDMQVGSKVMTPFDGIATVIAVFPQGVKDVYELTTLDGRKCECGLEHLWTVRTPKQVHKYRSHNKEWGWTMTLQTKDLIDGLSQGKKYFIPNNKAGGGFVEKFKQIFGADFVKVRESENPRVTFPNGTFVDLTYLDDSNMDKLRERAKGWEYDLIAIDELTEMTWEVFSYVMTRNRGQSKTFTGKFFATLNPKRSHWTRIFLDWYIGPDGFIIPERDGVVRYFYSAARCSYRT